MAVKVVSASATNYTSQIVRADFAVTALLAADAILCTLAMPCDDVLAEIRYDGSETTGTIVADIVDPAEMIADVDIKDTATQVAPVIATGTITLTNPASVKPLIVPVSNTSGNTISKPLWKTRVRLTTAADKAGSFRISIVGKISGAII